MNNDYISKASLEAFPVKIVEHPITKKPFDENKSKREVMVEVIKAIVKYTDK